MSLAGHPGGFALVREWTRWSETVRYVRDETRSGDWGGSAATLVLVSRHLSLRPAGRSLCSSQLQPKREASRSRGRKARWSGALCGRFAESALDWCGACT
jgi:hypothetical protein